MLIASCMVSYLKWSCLVVFSIIQYNVVIQCSVVLYSVVCSGGITLGIVSGVPHVYMCDV